MICTLRGPPVIQRGLREVRALYSTARDNGDSFIASVPCLSRKRLHYELIVRGRKTLKSGDGLGANVFVFVTSTIGE